MKGRPNHRIALYAGRNVLIRASSDPTVVGLRGTVVTGPPYVGGLVLVAVPGVGRRLLVCADHLEAIWEETSVTPPEPPSPDECQVDW